MNRFELAHLRQTEARKPGNGPALATEGQQLALAALGVERLRRLKRAFGVPVETPLPMISKAAAWQILKHVEETRGGRL